MPQLTQSPVVRHNTMKITLTIIISFLALSLFGQGSNTRFYFKTTYLNEKGKVFKSNIDTILVKQLLDIEFYKKHFNQPYYYPKPFINTNYKDTAIIVWTNTLEEKDFKANWTYTTVYDSLSRAIKYTYSGCLFCAQFPFYVKLYYDKANRPIRIEKRYGIGFEITNNKLKKSNEKGFADDDYRLEYDLQSNIIQLKCLKKGRLQIQIDRM